MGGLRRPHAKTRRGCARCKQRRVRCDLRPPICLNCERRGEACDYQALHEGEHAQPRLGSESSSGNTLVSPPQQGFHWEVHNLSIPISFELAIHFDARTSTTFDLPQTPLIWRKILINQADNQSYLRQSSLAVAALHLARNRPTQSDVRYLYDRAHVYQNKANAIFRGDVRSVNYDNGLTILGFCIMTIIFQCSASLIAHENFEGKQRMEILSPLLALRGGAALLVSHREVTIHHESLEGALGRWGADPSTFLLSPGQEDRVALDALEKAVLLIQRAGKLTPAAVQAFLVLNKVFTLFPSPLRFWLHVVYFPMRVSEAFFDELQVEQPGAIIAFIYWCAYLKDAMKQWYLEEWPRTAALHMIGRLETKWHSTLVWPQSRLGFEHHISLK